MTSRTKLWALSAGALALSLALAGCGGGGSSSSSSGLGSDDPPPAPSVDPTPAHVAIANIPQTTGFHAALTDALPDGTTKTHDITAADGYMWSPGGVRFVCDADEDAGTCTVNITVTKDADGNVNGVSATSTGGEVTATFIDPLENMNEPNEATLAGRMMNTIGEAGDSTATPPTLDGADDTAVLGGLKGPGTIGGSDPKIANAGADDINSVTLMGPFDPNVATSTLRAMADDDNASNDIGMVQAGALGLTDWSHKVLHADWGDTAGGLDAGIETAALIYSSVDPATSVPFEDVSAMLADATTGAGGLRTWFALTVNYGTGSATDGNDDTDDPNNTVVIEDAADALSAPQVANALISPSGQTFSGLVAHPDDNDEIRGEYFGASGTFKCTNDACQISRATTGGTPFALSAGQWHFMPDAGEEVTIPDQDWVAFGVWLTAPDNMLNGHHDIGVFYDGMETYAGVSTVADGTATFAGKAAGYYVNGEAHGLFTADAGLTAAFTDSGDMLSGTIQNFRDSAGRYIDTDNPDSPNDANQGGENDWGVTLQGTAINAAGTFDNAGTTGGTADGVVWSGNWMAQLYGPGGRATPVGAPTGVAGNFSAITAQLTDADGDPAGYKGVVGAFGADGSEWTPAATQ